MTVKCVTYTALGCIQMLWKVYQTKINLVKYTSNGHSFYPKKKKKIVTDAIQSSGVLAEMAPPSSPCSIPL